MKAIQDRSFYFFAMRMNWLSWFARPVVLLWRKFVRVARWFWSLCVLAWRSLVLSFSYRYWFLALIGGAVACFFVLYFYFLGIRLKQPNFIWIGTILASLPLGWSMAEIASLIRRKAVTGEEFSISEIRYQLGAGFKAVRMLLKYVFWAVLLVAVQIGMGLIVHIPSIGPALFTILMVPVIILSVFALVCILLLIFGLAIFPVHVLYSQPGSARGFFRRQYAEAAFILGFLRGNFFRLTFGMIPAVLLSLPLLAIPALVFGGAIGVTLFLTTRAMQLGSIFAEIPIKIQAVLMMLSRGNWDVWGALSAIFVSVSMAIFVGMVFSLVIAFLASFYFNIYTRSMYLVVDESGDKESDESASSEELELSEDDRQFLPLPEDLIEDEKFKLDDLDSETDFLGAEAATAGVGFEGSLPVFSTAPADQSFSISESDFDDISGDAILASIETTMPISEGVDGDNDFSADARDQDDDESFSLLDMDNPPGIDEDISGDDILASIESTMAIQDTPADPATGYDPAGVLPEDETLSIEDLTLDTGGELAGDISGEDILASIESTMPIVESSEDDFGNTLEEESEKLASLDVDAALEPDDTLPPAAEAGDDSLLEDLNNDLDQLLSGADTGEEMDAPQPAEAGDDLDALLAATPDASPVAEASGDDLDALLAGAPEESPAAAPVADDAEVSADGGDDLDALLGGAPDASPAAAPVADDAEASGDGGDDLDALLGGTPDASAAAAPVADDAEVSADGGDDLDALLAGAPEESPAAAPAEGSAELAGLDDDLDAFLGGTPDASAAAAPVADDAEASGDDLDALLGGTPEESPAAAPAEGSAELSGLDDDLDALLGGAPAAAPAAAPVADDAEASAGGDDLDALLGAAPAAQPAETSVPPAEVVPFSDKGSIRQFGYLVSVKEQNRVYFGIRGKDLPAPERFTLQIQYSGGGSSMEDVVIDSLDEKGMGYARLDLSERLTDPEYGAVTAVSVS